MESLLQEREANSSESSHYGIVRGHRMFISVPQEIHIMHEFDKDFYGFEMRAVVLGYIRPELDYTSRGAQ